MTDYVLGLCLTCFVLLAPAPLALRFAAGKKTLDEDLLATTLRCMSWWCGLQATIVIYLGAIGALSRLGLLVTHLILFVTGLRWFRAPHNPAPGRVARSIAADDLRPLIGIAVLFLVLAFVCLQEPMTDYDTISYHLPVMAQWAQTGSLAMPEWPVVLGLTHVARQPFSWEAVAAIPLVGMGEDSLVAVPNLLAWLWYGLAIAVLAERLGASRARALAAASVTMCIPAAAGNVNTMQVDVPFAAAIVTGLALSIRREPADRGALLPVAALIVGIRDTGLAYLAVVALWGLWWKTRETGKRPVPDAFGRSRLPGVLAGTIVLFLAGGFWYLRNWLEVSNPFGLLQVSIGGVTIFPGFVSEPPLIYTTLAGVFNPTALGDWWILLRSVAAELSLPFALLVATAARLAFSRGGSREGPLSVAPAVVLVTAMLLAYLLTPFGGDNGTNGWRTSMWIAQGLRFALPFAAAVGALAALGMERLDTRRIHTAILVGMSSVWAVLSVSPSASALAALLAMLTLGGLLYAALRMNSIRWWYRSLAARSLALVALGGALIVCAYGLRFVRNEHRVRLFGPIVSYVDERSESTDAVGYLLTHGIYVLHGSNLHGRVMAAPSAPNASDWIKELRAQRVTLVAVGPLLPGWSSSQELTWLNDGSRFAKVSGSDWEREIVLFGVRQPSSVGTPFGARVR